MAINKWRNYALKDGKVKESYIREYSNRSPKREAAKASRSNCIQQSGEEQEEIVIKGDEDMAKDKNWIAGAIKHPGALRKELHVKKGEKIPEKKLESAEKKGGVLGKRAQLAETLKGFNKKK